MTYTVKKGDTLYAIAKKHDTTVADLASANGIKDPTKLSVGQVLKIPSKVDHKALGEAVEKCLDDIEDLPSFKKVMELMTSG